MGAFGIIVGLAEETYGIITDDEKHVERGARRACIGAGTMLFGDFFGVSDTIAIAADVADANSA